MLKPKIQDALNSQLNAELVSSYLYLSMAAHFEAKNLRGMARWMHAQAREEWKHAMKFFDFIVSRSGPREPGGGRDAQGRLGFRAGGLPGQLQARVQGHRPDPRPGEARRGRDRFRYPCFPPVVRHRAGRGRGPGGIHRREAEDDRRNPHRPGHPRRRTGQAGRQASSPVSGNVVRHRHCQDFGHCIPSFDRKDPGHVLAW